MSAVHHHLVPAGRAGGSACARVGRAARPPLLPAHRLRRVAINRTSRSRRSTTRYAWARSGPYEQAEAKYRKAATKGVIKAISRMGIILATTARRCSRRSAQPRLRRRVLHLDPDPDRRQDRGRVQGGQGPPGPCLAALADRRSCRPAGNQYRADGENHLFNPLTIHTSSGRSGTATTAFKDYSSLVDDQSSRLATLRGLLEQGGARPIPIEEVEPVEAIVRRFKTGR